MTAPIRLPQPGYGGKPDRVNPFADIAAAWRSTRPEFLESLKADEPTANPFDDLAAHVAEEAHRHRDILARNEAGRVRDAGAPSAGDQLVAGAKDVWQAIRHPVETVKGMANSAAHDIRLSAGERIPRAGEIVGAPADLSAEEWAKRPRRC